MTVQVFVVHGARAGRCVSETVIDASELHRSAGKVDCAIRAYAQSQRLRNRADALDAALARLNALRKASRA